MIHELVLAVSFLTAACDNPTSFVSSSIPVPPAEFVVMNGRRKPVIRADVGFTCGRYWKTTYRVLDTYPNYMACMKRVARIGVEDGVRGICRRAAR